MKLKYVLISSILVLILTFTSVSASDNVTDEIAVDSDADVLTVRLVEIPLKISRKV